MNDHIVSKIARSFAGELPRHSLVRKINPKRPAGFNDKIDYGLFYNYIQPSNTLLFDERTFQLKAIIFAIAACFIMSASTPVLAAKHHKKHEAAMQVAHPTKIKKHHAAKHATAKKTAKSHKHA